MKTFLKNIIVCILTLEAKLVIKKYKPKVIAVTGSVGKTSTKDAIYTALSPFLSVRKNQKSFNSEIGVPLTILGLENAWSNPIKWVMNIFEGFGVLLFQSAYPKYLILEVGADRPGDIRDITKWLHPDVTVLTRIPDVPVHVERFGDRDGIYSEKSYLVRNMKKDGIVVLNADDDDIMKMGELAPGKVLHYGIDNPATITASGYDLNYDGDKLLGIKFRVNYESNFFPIILNGVLGKQHVYPVLAALSVGHGLGLPLIKLAESFVYHEYPKGRMNVFSVNGINIIDDTYNSSPVALTAALLALKDVRCEGRKIAVLGDMLELGSYSVAEHKKMGALIAKSADVLVTVGVRARDFATEANESKMKKSKIYIFSNSDDAGIFLKEFAQPGDTILAKGSQGVRVEKAIVPILGLDLAKEHLVRQEEEWSRR